MLRIYVMTTFCLAGNLASAQINKYVEKPTYDFKKEYSFHSEKPSSPLILSPFSEPKGLSGETPFAFEQPLSIRLHPVQAMPILHPELLGYGMPVLPPDPSTQYSLLIQKLIDDK